MANSFAVPRILKQGPDVFAVSPITIIGMDSPEHQAIAEAIDQAVQSTAGSGLIGVFEAQRRTFDYACLTKRDLARPLVAQVLWKHDEGLDKDIRTLLLDEQALIKVLAIQDRIRARATLDDILRSYRTHPELNRRLRGLKIFFIPAEFDADEEKQRDWLREHLRRSFSEDIAFAILFGGFTRRVFEVFMAHNGPFGLKYAVLDEIVKNGQTHMPTFKERLGYSTSGPIREALTMLNATGLTQSWASSNCYFPTIRGRFLLDFTRRILIDVRNETGWSDHTESTFEMFGCPLPEFPQEEITLKNCTTNSLASNLVHAAKCREVFGRDLLEGVDSTEPRLYSEFEIEGFVARMNGAPRFSATFFDQPDYLFYPVARRDLKKSDHQ